jgi:hypothetical protein
MARSPTTSRTLWSCHCRLKSQWTGRQRRAVRPVHTVTLAVIIVESKCFDNGTYVFLGSGSPVCVYYFSSLAATQNLFANLEITTTSHIIYINIITSNGKSQQKGVVQVTELKRLCTETVSDFNHKVPRPAPPSKEIAAETHLYNSILLHIKHSHLCVKTQTKRHLTW